MSATTADAPAAALAAWRPAIITEPGVYPDLRFEDYVRDPVPGGSLSNSEAKHLIPPKGNPARFRWEKDHKKPTRRVFEIGTAAHALVLGTGPVLVEIEADNWRGKQANQEADEARAEGAVPLLTHEYRMVQDMAAALRGHRTAAALFDPDRGEVEQSLLWLDGPTGVMRRARLDHLPHPTDGRAIIADYKTCESADAEACSKSMWRYGYNRQAAAYLDGARALRRAADDAMYVIVYQEKVAPYLVHVFEVDAMALEIGRAQNRAALELYARCVAEDRWPGWEDVDLLGVPGWIENAYLKGEL